MDQVTGQMAPAASGLWDRYTPAQRWTYMGVLFLAAVSSIMDRGIISLVLEPIKREFQLTDFQLGLLGGAPFGICFALASIPLARLADRYGRKVVLFWSIAGWSLMTGLCGLATTLPFLILARMGVGAAEGGSHPPAHALIADYFAPDQRGTAFAVFSLSGTVGMFVVSSLGAWITAAYGWRAAFFAMALISAPIALLVLGVLREPPRTATGPDDRGASFGADLAALLRKKSFRGLLWAVLFYAALPYGVLVFTPSYMVRVLGVELALAGPIFGATASLGAVVGSLVGGRLSDVLSRRDERWLLWLPACFLAANAIASIVAFTATGLTGFVVLQAISVALGFAPFPSLIAAGQHVCGSTRRATVTAAAAVVLNAIGGSLAPLTIGALSDGFAPSAGTQSLRYAMMAISLALLPAAFAAWRGARDLPQDRED